MKTVITSSGDTVSARFDKRFGRAAWFCIFNEETGETSFIENRNHEANNGAGTKAAEKMLEIAAGKIISGDFGPKAKELLMKFDVQMVIIQDDDVTVGDIIHKLKN